MSQFFKLAADYCEEAYGCEVIEEKNVVIGFICPNCGELIYSEDWTDEDTDNWTLCPICEEFFGEEEQHRPPEHEKNYLEKWLEGDFKCITPM